MLASASRSVDPLTPKPEKRAARASRSKLISTYWGITTQIGDYVLADAFNKDSSTTAALQRVRTRLNKFSAEEQGKLISWGYALTDAAMRKWALPAGAPKPARWPDERFPL